jgi:hypothetical protein
MAVFVSPDATQLVSGEVDACQPVHDGYQTRNDHASLDSDVLSYRWLTKEHPDLDGTQWGAGGANTLQPRTVPRRAGAACRPGCRGSR